MKVKVRTAKIFPAGVDFTESASMGQYSRMVPNIFETVLYVERPRKEILIGEDKLKLIN